MSKLFKKAGEVQLVNGGYLSDSDENPIKHPAFVAAQKRANWLVLLAGKMKGKTFTAEQPADINALISELDSELSSADVKNFVTVPTVSKGEVTQKLADEALAFMQNTDKADFANKVNEKMQEFNIISEFETFGLFFKSGVVKLDKIYSIEEITSAAKVVYAVLD